jgi:hypothetical protein
VPRPTVPCLALATVLAGGCFFDPGPSRGGTDGGADGSANPTGGFGKPTLEVTVSGMHFGPIAPDTGSSVSLVDTVQSGQVIQSTFSLLAASAASGASCAFAFQREGSFGVAPIGARGYIVTGGATSPTPEGAVAASGTEQVAVPQLTLVCSGETCNGANLVLTALDAAHAEGYVAGTFSDSLGRGVANVSCAFYLPVAAYQP